MEWRPTSNGRSPAKKLKRSFGSSYPKRRPFQSHGFKTTVKTESISKAVAAVDDVDYSAAETLRSLFGILKEKGIRLVVAQVLDDVKAEIDTENA